MKDLARLFARWVIIVLLALNIMLGVVIIARCQEVHEKHATQADVEDTMGFISVQFLSIDDRLIYWRRETKYEVKLSSFAYDKYTKFETTTKDKLSGKLCIIYCKTHLFAYLVTPCK